MDRSPGISCGDLNLRGTILSGILLRQLQLEGDLPGISHIFIDEVKCPRVYLAYDALEQGRGTVTSRSPSRSPNPSACTSGSRARSEHGLHACGGEETSANSKGSEGAVRPLPPRHRFIPTSMLLSGLGQVVLMSATLNANLFRDYFQEVEFGVQSIDIPGGRRLCTLRSR